MDILWSIAFYNQHDFSLSKGKYEYFIGYFPSMANVKLYTAIKYANCCAILITEYFVTIHSF